MTYRPLSPIVTSHNRAGNMQIDDGDNTGKVSLSITTIMALNTWETIGPTGSGANNIWTEMDQIPDNATALIVDQSLTVSTSGTGTGALTIYATIGGGTVGPDFEDNCIGRLLTDHDAAVTGNDAHIHRVIVALDGSLRCRVRWQPAGSESLKSCAWNYRGFMTD